MRPRVDVTGGTDSRIHSFYTKTSRPLSDGLIQTDTDFEVVACNSAASQLLQTIDTQCIGTSLWTLFPDSRGTIAQTEIETALESQQQRSFKWYAGESQTWVEVLVFPSIDGLTLVLTKLRSDGRRHRNIDLYKSELEPASVGGWKIDLPSETLHVSEEVLRIRGLPADYDLTIEEGIQFYHPEDRRILTAAVDRLKNGGETYDLELREVRENGDIYWVRTTGIADYNESGEIIALRGVYRDITERKESELELQQKTRELERQNERLDNFANVISHDLRNPLNVAQGRLGLAREQLESEHFDVIERSLSRMQTLIEEVLDLARHGKAVHNPAPVELTVIVQQSWEAVETAGAQLISQDRLTILADRNRMKQLFENLMRNAIEHGGEDVTVTIGALDDGFFVEDNGPGIPVNEREQVFESGYTTSSSGTGFGLAIIKEIADAHHWNVQITESSGGGTRFECTGVEMG